MPVQCLACKAVIERGSLVCCMKCRGAYHYQCNGIHSDDIKKNFDYYKKSWECLSCSNDARRLRNNNTPIRKGLETPNNDNVTPVEINLDGLTKYAPKSAIKSLSALDSKESAVISYDDFEKLLDSKLRNMAASITQNIAQNIKTTIKNEINQAIEILKSEFTQTTDFLAAEQIDLKGEIKITSEKMHALETENSKMSLELMQLKSRLRSLEKASRNCNIEIQSAPENKQENLLQLMNNLCEQLACTLSDNDICSIRRVAKLNTATDRPRNILVTLSSQRHRDNLITAFKEYKKAHRTDPLNSIHLGIPGDQRNIYVVEHLPIETKELHAAARKVAKERSYKYVWVKYGRVYVRKQDDSTPIHILDHSCLKKLQ